MSELMMQLQFSNQADIYIPIFKWKRVFSILQSFQTLHIHIRLTSTLNRYTGLRLGMALPDAIQLDRCD